MYDSSLPNVLRLNFGLATYEDLLLLLWKSRRDDWRWLSELMLSRLGRDVLVVSISGLGWYPSSCADVLAYLTINCILWHGRVLCSRGTLHRDFCRHFLCMVTGRRHALVMVLLWRLADLCRHSVDVKMGTGVVVGMGLVSYVSCVGNPCPLTYTEFSTCPCGTLGRAPVPLLGVL